MLICIYIYQSHQKKETRNEITFWFELALAQMLFHSHTDNAQDVNTFLNDNFFLNFKLYENHHEWYGKPEF